MPYDPSNLAQRLLIVVDTFASLISASPYLAAAPTIPVLTERKGDLNAEIAKALNNLGLSIVVITADGATARQQGTRVMIRARLVAEISENVLLNQSKSAASGNYRSALEAATAVICAVTGQPNGLPGGSEFELDEQPYRLVPAPRPTYHVTAHTLVPL